MDAGYYLIDLERSILSGYTTYWKPFKHGYTRDLSEAGLYSKEVAKEIALNDLDQRTVIIDKKVVERLK